MKMNSWIIILLKVIAVIILPIYLIWEFLDNLYDQSTFILGNFINKCINTYKKYVNILINYVDILINYCKRASYLSNFVLCPSLVRALTRDNSFIWSKNLYPDLPPAIINQQGKGINIFIGGYDDLYYSTFAWILKNHLTKGQSYVGILAVISNSKIYVWKAFRFRSRKHRMKVLQRFIIKTIKSTGRAPWEVNVNLYFEPVKSNKLIRSASDLMSVHVGYLKDESVNSKYLTFNYNNIKVRS